ncbi:MAG: pilus assembly protein PilM, partial [Calditrichaeota bacterium]|nr:pilus assembly protein PilM [Calditrichota bacterium]
MIRDETLFHSPLPDSEELKTAEELLPEELSDDDFVDFDFLKNQVPEESALPQDPEERDETGQKGDLIDDILHASDKTFRNSAPDFEFLQNKWSENPLELEDSAGGQSSDDLSDLLLSEGLPESAEQFLPRETAEESKSVVPSQEHLDESEKSPPLFSSEISPDLLKRLQSDSKETDGQAGKPASSESGHQITDPLELKMRAAARGESAPWDFVSGSFSRKWSLGSLVETGLYLGLDIGQGVTKYVLVKKKGHEKVVRAFGILDNPRGIDLKTRVHQVLDHLEKQGLLDRSKINLAIYGPDVGIHRISLPPLKKKELSEATEWSLKKKFDFQNQEIINDFLVLGKKKIKGVEHNDILAGMVPTSLVEEKIEPFLEKKITPWHLRPLPSVLWSLYHAAHIQDEGSCVAMVDIGARKTLITFIREGAIEFAREIPSGGDDITEGMTATIFHEGQAFQLSWEEAEGVKRTFGFPLSGDRNTSIRNVPLVEIGALMRPHLERLTSEIQRSIDYYRENFSVNKIDRVYLLGGTAGLQNLVEFLKMEIDEEIELFQFSTHFPLNLPSNEAKTFHNRFLELAVALGLAIDTGRSLNLLPEPLRKVETIKLQRRLFFYLSFLTIITIVFLSGTSFLRVSSLKNQFRQMQLEYKKIQPKKRHYDALLTRRKFLLSKKQIYQSELILDNPLPNILKLVSQMMPPEMALTGMSVTREEIAPKKNQKGTRQKTSTRAGNKATKGKKKAPAERASFLRLKGVRYHPRPDEGIRIANFMLRLRDSGYFQSVMLLNQSL